MDNQDEFDYKKHQEEHVYIERTFFPQNIAVRDRTKGLGLSAKMYVFIAASIVLVLGITYAMYSTFADNQARFIFGIIGFGLGVLASFLLYSIIFSGQDEKASVASDVNKFMKIASYGDTDNDLLSVPLIRYTNQNVAILVSFYAGGVEENSISITENFTDKFVHFMGSRRLDFSAFTLAEKWTGSTMRDEYYDKINKLYDKKLRNSLVAIDKHLTPTFNKMKVVEQVFVISAPVSKLKDLEDCINFIKDFKNNYLESSNLRDIQFNSVSQSFNKCARFVGSDMGDLGDLSIDPSLVSLVTKALIKINSEIDIDTLSEEVQLKR